MGWTHRRLPKRNPNSVHAGAGKRLETKLPTGETPIGPIASRPKLSSPPFEAAQRGVWGFRISASKNLEKIARVSRDSCDRLPIGRPFREQAGADSDIYATSRTYLEQHHEVTAKRILRAGPTSASLPLLLRTVQEATHSIKSHGR